MRAYLAVTDHDWFRFLSSLKPLEEVNFWQPSGSRRFRHLTPGELFLFKLHAPRNYVVGGGYFTHSSLLPASLAWESFGVGNGALSFDEMRRRIEKYRRVPPDPFEDYQIGCILLSQPFFFDEIDWIPVPEDWSRNIVQGKGYDRSTPEGQRLLERVSILLQDGGTMEIRDSSERMFGDPVEIRPRLGQGSFRILITDTYRRRCAVTGEKALPTLEAAHIRPVAQGGIHRIDNGLLLRSDIHRLYDRGYVTVTPDHRFEVSRRLKDDFDNGEPYYPLDGREIWLPSDPAFRPRRDHLEWHADTVFRR